MLNFEMVMLMILLVILIELVIVLFILFLACGLSLRTDRDLATRVREKAAALSYYHSYYREPLTQLAVVKTLRG